MQGRAGLLPPLPPPLPCECPSGLLRTVLEAQETRGLTRSDDISRLLPAEAALLARGRTVSDSMDLDQMHQGKS